MGTHPWLTPEVLELVAAKRRAKETAEEKLAAKACSEETLKAYTAYAQRVRKELSELPAGSKK